MLGIMADMDQKDSSLPALVVTMALACARLVLLVILHLALSFSPSCRHAQMLGILAGMDQIDSKVMVPMVQTAGAEAGFRGPFDHRDSPVAPVHVVDVVQLPRWFAVLGHAGDMPVVAGITTGRTAPAAEPAAISFTVPLTGSTIDATAAIVTSYSSSADGPDSGPLCAAGVFASRCRVVVDLSLLMVLTILFGSV